jgi:hypothetical protein
MVATSEIEQAVEAFLAGRVDVDGFFRAWGLCRNYDQSDYHLPNLADPKRVGALRSIGERSTSFFLNEFLASRFSWWEATGAPIGAEHATAALEIATHGLAMASRVAPRVAASLLSHVAWGLSRLERHDEARAQASRALEWDATNLRAAAVLAESLGRLGRVDEAGSWLAWLVRCGDKRGATRAREALGRKPKAGPASSFVPPFVGLALGDEERELALAFVGPNVAGIESSADGERARSKLVAAASASEHAIARAVADALASKKPEGIGDDRLVEAARTQAAVSVAATLPVPTPTQAAFVADLSAKRLAEWKKAGELERLALALATVKHEDAAAELLAGARGAKGRAALAVRGLELIGEYVGVGPDKPRSPQRLPAKAASAKAAPSKAAASKAGAKGSKPREAASVTPSATTRGARAPGRTRSRDGS